MEHRHKAWQFWWHYGCAPCKLQQLQRGDKGSWEYQQELIDIKYGKWTDLERTWLLSKLGEL